MKKLNLDFFELFFFVFALSAPIVLVQKIFFWVLTDYQLSFDSLHWLQSLPIVGGIFVVFFIVMRKKKVSLIESIRYIGLKKMNLRQIVVCLCLVMPIIFGTFVTFKKYEQDRIPISLMANWHSYLFYIVVSVGFFEEIVYRGFVFQTLRKKRSFFSAAALSGLLWSFSHVCNFAFDQHETKLVPIIALFIWPFILAFPSAYLFERSGNVIWGWMLVHLSIDWVFILDFGNDYPIDIVRNENIYRSVSVFLTAILTFPLAKWLLPIKGLKKIIK